MITLDPIAKSHLEYVQRYASDKRISDTCNVPHPYTKAMAGGWYAAVLERQRNGVSKVFAILDDGEFAGVISINNIDTHAKRAEVDYWVAVRYQGKGIATSAVKEAISYARDCLAVSEIFSGCLAKNASSLAVQRKNGFVEVKHIKLKDGKFAGEDYVISKLRLE